MDRTTASEAKPYHLVEANLATGTLVPLRLAELDAPASISMSAIYRTDTPSDPAGRWLIDRLKHGGHTNFGSEPLSSHFAKPAPQARPAAKKRVHGGASGLDSSCFAWGATKRRARRSPACDDWTRQLAAAGNGRFRAKRPFTGMSVAGGRTDMPPRWAEVAF